MHDCFAPPPSTSSKSHAISSRALGSPVPTSIRQSRRLEGRSKSDAGGIRGVQAACVEPAGGHVKVVDVLVYEFTGSAS
jgi:hypothetical protein